MDIGVVVLSCLVEWILVSLFLSCLVEWILVSFLTVLLGGYWCRCF